MQRIVHQLASISYSPFPALPAPLIAGLLPARCGTTATPQIIVAKSRQSLRDRRHVMWAAQDAELEMFLEAARRRLAAVYEEVTQEAARHPDRPFIWDWEMAS